jgi:hypothetical protein
VSAPYGGLDAPNLGVDSRVSAPRSQCLRKRRRNCNVKHDHHHDRRSRDNDDVDHCEHDDYHHDRRSHDNDDYDHHHNGCGPCHRGPGGWDGTTCSYEGPETAPVGAVISFTFRNEDDLVADLGIDYLARGVTLEEAMAVWPTEATSATDYPGNTYPLAFLPEYPISVDPGGEFTADVTIVAARQQSFPLLPCS